MGCRVRPVTTVVICALVLSFLIAVSVLTYKWKQGSLSTKANASQSNGSGIGSGHQKKCEGPEWECNIRLNPHVLPVHYDLYLHPDFESGLFKGKVSILLNVTSPTNHIRLHTKFLNVTSTQLAATSKNEEKSLEIRKSFEVPSNEFWVVQPASPSLDVGTYVLTIKFDGSLTKGITGFYRSKYLDPIQNVTKFLVSSKFQPTYARRAFTCFDEPSFKSTFSVTLVKPSHLVALSNMPVQTEELREPSPQLTTVTFEKSVPMVTYLVAFAIGEFDYRNGTTKSGIPVRVYSTSFKAPYTEYAASITPKIIDAYEEYFDIKYPLPKLDIIGVPDFVSGAMEHWGMISFREVNLLWRRGVASAVNKQRIASVIAHELAHMWFGNLMTLKWWDDLWINEGFASYIEYKGVDAVHPDWDLPSQFVSDDLTPVLRLDGQLSSHPIVQPVSHPDQITEIFDTISYSKGASVIRMLENFMGPKNFQHGVTKFLRKFSFKNAVTADLWSALQSEAPQDVSIEFVMDTWTRQMGYPVLTVTRSPSSSTRFSGVQKTVSVSQQRFLDNPNQKDDGKFKESPFGYKWEIPLLFSTSAGPSSTRLVWLRHTKTSIDLPVTNDTEWVKVNTGQLGYFRVKYDTETLNKIKKDYMEKFSPEERCGLLDDLFSLAFSNYTGYDTALDFALVLTNEQHLVPWKCNNRHLQTLLDLLGYASAETYELYRNYVNEVTQVQFKRLAWSDSESDPHLERLMKPIVFSLSCEQGIGECREKVQTLFTQWIQDKNFQIPSSLRALVYKWGIAQNNETIWNLVWKRYLVETDAAEKMNLLRALSSTKEAWIVSRLLEYGKNETLVKRQDYFYFLRFIASNPVGNPVLWNFYRNEYPKLVERFGANDRYFGRVIKDITTDYCSEVQLQEMETLFKLYPEAGAGTRARESSYETVQNNILWKRRSVPVIHSWLKSRYPKSTTSTSVPNFRNVQ